MKNENRHDKKRTSCPSLFRKRTIEYRKSGHTLKETSEAFKVSISAIEDWERTLKESGNWEKKALNRHHKKSSPEKLRAYVEKHPDAYQREVAEKFNCSVTATKKALKRLGFTRKKTTHYKEQDSEKIKNYQEQIKGIPPENLAYIDETGMYRYLFHR